MSKSIDAHILAKYKVGELIGSGAYGHVWKVQDKLTHRNYALKKVFGAFRNNVDAQRTYREVEILQKLDHPNIIKLHKVLGADNKQDLYLVFELMETDLLAVVGTAILNHTHHKYILFQILKAIAHLHEIKLLHRDLKPSNVLLDSDCRIKICDFGLVRSLAIGQQQHPILSEQVATRWYRAPQLLLGSRTYSYPADIWSIGCIAAELLTGKPLFEGNSTLQQLEKIIEFTGAISKEDLESLDSPVVECLVSQIKPKYKSFAEYFSLVSPQFYPLVKGCLQFNPHKRFTAKEALSLDIFSQFAQEVRENQQLSIKAIIPQMDDNKRFSLKDYRKEIYSNIPSQLKASSDKRRVPQPGLFKNQSIKSLTSKKKISKTVWPIPKKEDLPKKRQLSKAAEHVSAQKKRFSQGFVSKTKQKVRAGSSSLEKKSSPYKQEINKLEGPNASSSIILKPFQKKLPQLKKTAKKQRKDYKFRKL